MTKFVVMTEFTEHFRDVDEFETLEKALSFAKVAKLTARTVEVFEERTPVGSTRVLQRVSRFEKKK